jgi:hypothetical protein
MSIPENLFIISLNEKSTTYYKELKPKFDSADMIYLALFLHDQYSLGVKSFYSPFINYLPDDFTCFPYYYSQEERKLVSNTFLEDEISSWNSQLKFEYNLVTNNFPLHSIKFEEYVKMRHLSWSRNFNMNFNGVSYGTMIPIADLFNFHPEKVNLKWAFDLDHKCFSVRAHRDINAGEELFLSYGQEDNAMYLFYYGFIISNNPNKLTVELKKEGDEVIKLTRPVEIERLIYHYRKSKKSSISKLKLELNALNKFDKELVSRLINYTTNIDSDKISLLKAKNESNFNMMNIYTYLIEEKQLITDYLETIRLIRDCLDPRYDNNTLKNSLQFINVSPKYVDSLKDYLANK